MRKAVQWQRLMKQHKRRWFDHHWTNQAQERGISGNWETNITYREAPQNFSVSNPCKMEMRCQEKNKKILDIVRFRRSWTEFCLLLGYYAAWGGSEQTFRDYIFVAPSRFNIMGPIRSPETSVWNHLTPRHNPEDGTIKKIIHYYIYNPYNRSHKQTNSRAKIICTWNDDIPNLLPTLPSLLPLVLDMPRLYNVTFVLVNCNFVSGLIHCIRKAKVSKLVVERSKWSPRTSAREPDVTVANTAQQTDAIPSQLVAAQL